MKLPLVSIIMNCHNGDLYLKESLKSVLKQKYKNWELIFWDNCSTDNSKQIIKKLKDKRIKYFFSGKFNTLYKSRNLAIKKAKGKYISFLDVDDKWSKDKLSLQVKKLEKCKGNFIYSNYFIENISTKKIYKRILSKLPEGKITQELLNDYFLGILTVLVKRDIFKKFQFNTKYNIIGDFDFFITLSQKYDFLCIQKPLSTFKLHYDNYSTKNLNEYYEEVKKWLQINNFKINKKFDLKNMKLILFKLKLKKNFKLLKDFF